MADSYFLPPVVKRVPVFERVPLIRSPRYRHFLWYWRGVELSGTTAIAGVSYQGGRWHGPLSAQQIADITAAGYGARIYAVTDIIQLPADIDS